MSPSSIGEKRRICETVLDGDRTGSRQRPRGEGERGELGGVSSGGLAVSAAARCSCQGHRSGENLELAKAELPLIPTGATFHSLRRSYAFSSKLGLTQPTLNTKSGIVRRRSHSRSMRRQDSVGTQLQHGSETCFQARVERWDFDVGVSRDEAVVRAAV